MSKFKKVLALLLVVALTAALSVSLTMAYLQDTDEQVNVMTLGNVYIDQHEYQRAEGVAHNAGESGADNGVKEGALVPFEQGQKLYPAVPANNAATDYSAEATDLFYWGDYVHTGTAGNGLWNDSKLANVMDKMIFVENTGKSDCYFRTIIAFECPEGITIGEAGQGAEIMINRNGSDVYTWDNSIGYIFVDDVRYAVLVATYQNALKPGNQSHPSLLQVVMTHNATNEDMELLGDSYEILALSQAVQTEGFADAETALNTAFGEITTNNHPWIDGVKIPVIVSTAKELTTALAAGKSVVLTEDIDLGAEEITISGDATLNLNGNDLTGNHSAADHYAMFTIPTGASLTIEGNGNVTATTESTENNRSLALFQNSGSLTINGGSYKVTDGTNGMTWIIATIVDNRTTSASCNALLTINGGEFTVEGNAINLFRNYPQQGGSATIVFNGGIFKANSSKETTYIWNQESSNYLGELYFNGGTYDNNVVYEDYNGQSDIHIADGVIINGYSGNN